ncbi:MAG: TonB C-terminal domain-containing protein [Candidatus Acidiferrales bacterium]|jgi:outer membrane biosynthesis protein TonB
MIPRTLVPVDVRPFKPGEEKAAPRRLSSTLDERTFVPRDLPIKQLDPTSNIPDHVPFDVIVGRSLVQRGWHVDPRGGNGAARRIETSLDDRTVVPALVERPTQEDRAKLEELPALTADRLDVIDPDVMTTGEVNLLVDPHEERDARWNNFSRMFSVAVHVGLILLALSSPELFKHVPTQAEIESARKQLGTFMYLPPDANLAPPRAPGRPGVRISPNTLNRVAPPLPSPSPAPAETKPTIAPPVAELPSSPQPKPVPAQPSANDTPLQPIKPATDPQPGRLNLSIPNVSPGRALENSVQNAIKGSGGAPLGAEGRIPGDGGGGGGGGGGGTGKLGNQISIISDTQGVDFSAYLRRLLATVRQNWYAIIPESARLGDKGMVIIQFKIMKDGNVPNPDPTLTRTSGKEPLDRAAMSSIRASSPFEPLPSAFTLPFIELRFIFLYNLPLDYQ